MNEANIRNFAIVAHVDHGKSTLADRLLEFTNTIPKREMTELVLDSNPIEKERGITIKLAPVRMKYRYQDQEYLLNLIDTPGHVDFSYEVSRSLAACEGVVLVVDATQGIQAQTLAYMQQVMKRKLKVIPVINKIDLPIANVNQTKNQLKKTFGFNETDFIEISAKQGTNINLLIKAIIEKIPAPKGDLEKELRMLVFSSVYETHRGVVCFVKVVDGILESKKREELLLMASGISLVPVEIGYFSPKMIPSFSLSAGEVGFIATGLKDIHQAKVGDTITFKKAINVKALEGYAEPKPMVFLGLFPVDSDQFTALREAIEKLHLTDGAFTFRPINSPALGNGFHCGFLGRLHADIVHERLEREFGLSLIRTLPQVSYVLKLRSGKTVHVEYAQDFPDPSLILSILEPMMSTKIYSSKEYVGQIMELCSSYRGVFVDLKYLDHQVIFEYLLPLSELILDFFDKLKSISSGYATVDYEFYDYEPVDAVKMDILVHYQKVDALSIIVVKSKVNEMAKAFTKRLKTAIPRHNFEIPIQATIGGKIIAREDIKAFRKDVTAKLYGGDRTRKDKLLDTQREGKKKMKKLGRVEIPKEAFLSVLKSE